RRRVLRDPRAAVPHRHRGDLRLGRHDDLPGAGAHQLAGRGQGDALRGAARARARVRDRGAGAGLARRGRDRQARAAERAGLDDRHRLAGRGRSHPLRGHALLPRSRHPGAAAELGDDDQPRPAVHLHGLVVQRVPRPRDHAGGAGLQLPWRCRARRAGGGGVTVTETVSGGAPAWLSDCDAFLSKLFAEAEVPGAAVCVTQGDRLVYARGFGWRGREARLPVTPRTVFGLASLSKSFTALAALLLEARGVWSLRDPVARHLPGFGYPGLD